MLDAAVEVEPKVILRVEGLPPTPLTLSSVQWLLARDFPDELLLFRQEMEATVDHLEPGAYLGEVTLLAMEGELLRQLLFVDLLDLEDPPPDDLRDLELKLRQPESS
jgi:hypothetical protein